ncbi:hypothetical protein BK133_19435 [Paenibacillus sp. FSL H8-0548]|uniref:hypothetical protein n=1 Tax=Paenibacillus sp. FSL H8-0548 TaxID=1920422 RepID=UPI00096C2CBC|nr:hypothetical protein [Paenibacillus sp. FSL H8-0548]OMF27625.1 hypothetical protein BK133_19435 [Paenibacillus sp. FSL H8-0548]
MNEIDSYESSKWSKIRARGRVLYAIRWIIYLALFFGFMQVVLLMVSDKTVGFLSILAMLLISIVLGIAVSIIRWSVFENNHKR